MIAREPFVFFKEALVAVSADITAFVKYQQDMLAKAGMSFIICLR